MLWQRPGGQPWSHSSSVWERSRDWRFLAGSPSLSLVPKMRKAAVLTLLSGRLGDFSFLPLPSPSAKMEARALVPLGSLHHGATPPISCPLLDTSFSEGSRGMCWHVLVQIFTHPGHSSALPQEPLGERTSQWSFR